jgi:outer membrane protein
MAQIIRFVGGLVFLAAVAMGGPSSVWAADMAVKASVAKIPVDAWSPWMIRGRVLVVAPQASATIDQIPGASVSIGTSVVPELDITYFLSRNFAAEVILGVTPHNIDGTGAIAGISVGRAWLLPPTVLLQYHFTEMGALKPYIGVGPNYTIFFNQSAAGGVITQLSIKNTFGVAAQVGIDYMWDRHWGWNIDVKKLFLRPSVSMNNGALTGQVRIDPWIIGTGVTYRF